MDAKSNKNNCFKKTKNSKTAVEFSAKCQKYLQS